MLCCGEGGRGGWGERWCVASPPGSGRDLMTTSVVHVQLEKTYEGYGSPARRASVDTEAGNTMRVYALKFHPDNENIFISAGWDNHIKVSLGLSTDFCLTFRVRSAVCNLRRTLSSI